ncbi:MAG: ACP S-malonyltransferase [Pseudanabaenaceae cyanobacterium]|jgi:[acyl-carrier-protein] S-malonyltransferase
MKTIWVFPGQGSQASGMNADLATVGAAKFAEASDILGWSVLDKCQDDPIELAKTQYTQPCLYTVSAILVDLLKAKGLQPDLVAGHSLGEYTALYAAGVIDFTTGLQLVQTRSTLMAECTGGAMVAMIGFKRDELEAAIANTNNVVLANDNSAEQVVISGTPEAINQVTGKVKAKRAIPLAVSGAFHSPLMAEAAAKFALKLDTVTFADGKIPVLSNVEPNEPLTQGKDLHHCLRKQITSPVRWREICLYLAQEGYEQAVEVGSGKVLTGLIKRTAPTMKLVNISTLADVENFVASFAV